MSRIGELMAKPYRRSLHLTPAERFWEKVDYQDDCWVWTGKTNNTGYGLFFLNYKWVSAHRFSVYLRDGDVDDDLFVCHHCDNPPCVKPSHLFVGTAQDNMTDMARKGRRKNRGGRSGEAHHQAKLTKDQVAEIRHQYREGLTIYQIAELYPVAPQQISRIIRGERWVA